MTYGYARVSSRDQNEDRQLLALSQFGVPEKQIFVDKQSGKDFDRPAYQRMIRRLKEGDLLVMKSIDRLGRNYEEILNEWKKITRDRGADVYIIDMPLLDTRRGKDLLGTFISDLVLQLLSFVAENERENIRRRQAEGIQAAKLRGVKFGRPQLPIPDEFADVCTSWREGQYTAKEAAHLLGFSVTTLYRKSKILDK